MQLEDALIEHPLEALAALATRGSSSSPSHARRVGSDRRSAPFATTRLRFATTRLRFATTRLRFEFD
jgi:hypothetical protein